MRNCQWWIGLMILGWFAQNLPAQDLYDKDRVVEIRVEFQNSSWKKALKQVKKSKQRILAGLSVDGERYEDVGVRFKGNSSYNAVRGKEKEKLPFNIKVDHHHEDQHMSGGYGTLKLSNSFRDPSYVREILAYELAGRYMPSPRANVAQLYINDEFFGTYHSSESIDKDFLRKHFGHDEGFLYKCDPEWDVRRPERCESGDGRASLMYLGPDPACYHGLYELKSDTGWQELIHLTEVLNHRTEAVDSILNVDQVLWMHAFNNITVNLDSYLGEFCHNYYLYRDTFGVFHPIVWDMNLAFGGFFLDGLGHRLHLEDMQEMSMFIHYKQQNEQRPLITKLLSVDLYRKIYLAHMRTILEEVLLSGEFEKRARALHERLRPLVEMDDNRLYSLEAFDQNLESSTMIGQLEIVGVLELMNGRAEYLKNHPLLSKTPPALVSESIEVVHRDDNHIRLSIAAEGGEQVWLMVRDAEDGRPFRRLQMSDDGSRGDEVPDDGIYALELPDSQVRQYYFIVEGKYEARLLPRHASRGYFSLAEHLAKN